MAVIAHLSSQPLPLSEVPANLRKHVDPNAPPPLRDMGARGLVPGLSPTDMALIFFQLQFDPDDKIRETATKTFAELPEQLARPMATAEMPAPVLDFCARRWLTKRDELIELVIRNRAVGDETVAFIGNKGSDRLAEIVAENQVRLERAPYIIEQVYQNPRAHQSLIDRIIEFAVRQNIDVSDLPAIKMAVEAHGQDQRRNPKAPDDNTFSAILQDSVKRSEEEDRLGITTEQIQERMSEFNELLEQVSAQEDASDEDTGKLLEKSKSGEEGEERRITSRQVLMQRMSISEKVRLATVGSKEDRALLIRDPNRLVHMSALLSPKIRPEDYKDFAGNKDLPKNVINFIAGKKDATRDYTMLLRLVNNPKLDLARGMRMLNFVRTNDLRTLAKNRNVSPQLAKAAKNMLGKRQT